MSAPLPVVAGLPLDAYAFVHAALGEGFAMDEVLQHLGLDASSWPSIDEAWADALADSLDTDFVLSDAYDAELLACQVRFTRSVEPLGSDYASFSRFFRRWSGAESPSAFLADHGLRSVDMMRLHRYWTVRLQDDDELRRFAAQVAGEVETVPTPSIAVGPPRTLSEVRPPTSTATHPAQSAAPRATPTTASAAPLPPLLAALPTPPPTTAAPSVPIADDAFLRGTASLLAVASLDADLPELTPEQYGELHAHLAVNPLREEEICRQFGLDSTQLTRLDERFRERFEADPSLSSRFQRAYDDTYQTLRRPSRW